MAKPSTPTRAANEEARRVEPNHSAVSLPAGSYDFETLHAGLDKAVDTYDNRDEEVAKAIDTARVGEAPSRNPAVIPDHKFVEVPLALDEEGKAVQTETIQVYDPAKADQHVEPTVIAGGTTNPTGLDEKGHPTDLEKARIAAVKGEEAEPARIPPPPPSEPTDSKTSDGANA